LIDKVNAKKLRLMKWFINYCKIEGTSRQLDASVPSVRFLILPILLRTYT